MPTTKNLKKKLSQNNNPETKMERVNNFQSVTDTHKNMTKMNHLVEIIFIFLNTNTKN